MTSSMSLFCIMSPPVITIILDSIREGRLQSSRRDCLGIIVKQTIASTKLKDAMLPLSFYIFGIHSSGVL